MPTGTIHDDMDDCACAKLAKKKVEVTFPEPKAPDKDAAKHVMGDTWNSQGKSWIRRLSMPW